MKCALVLALLAGCSDGYECAVARWSIATGRLTAVQGIADGSLIAFVGDAGSTTIGDRAVTGPALLRIGPDGDLATVVELAHAGYGTHLLADDTGAPIVSWGEPMGEITRYDRDFQQTWEKPISTGALAIAPTGEVAVADQHGLHYFDRAGAERWTALDGGVLQLTTTGDVLVFDHAGQRRRRLAAASGALVESVEIPGLPSDVSSPAYARDGGFVFIDAPLRTVITDVGPDGTTRFALPLRAWSADPVFASDGSIVAVTAIGTQIIRIDAATGAILARHDTCDIADRIDPGQPIIFASPTGYVLGGGGALAAYDGP